MAKRSKEELKQRINRHRIRPEDMAASMHPSKQEEIMSNRPKPTGDVEVFTIRSRGDYIDEDNNHCLLDTQNRQAMDRDEAYARREFINIRERYFVKQGPNGKLYDPFGLFNEGHVAKRRAGIEQWKWREVPQSCFNLYLAFLKTKNKAHLTHAEREIS
jgi:hypothetical protein